MGTFDFTADAMQADTYDEKPSPLAAGKTPDMPNLQRVLETKNYGMTALWISELRRRLNMTQTQLAHAIGCTSTTIGAWERGDAQPINEQHRASLTRAGNARNMPPLPEAKPGARPAFGPRIDPRTEELFNQHFGV